MTSSFVRAASISVDEMQEACAPVRQIMEHVIELDSLLAIDGAVGFARESGAAPVDFSAAFP